MTRVCPAVSLSWPMRKALAPLAPVVSSTQALLAKPAVIAELSRVSVAVSGTRLFFEPADLSFAAGATVRGAGTFAQLAGITGSGGRQARSVRLDGSHVPITLGPIVAPPPVPLEPPALVAPPVPDPPPVVTAPPLPAAAPALVPPPVPLEPPVLIAPPVLDALPVPVEPPELPAAVPGEPPVPAAPPVDELPTPGPPPEPVEAGPAELEEPHAPNCSKARAPRIPRHESLVGELSDDMRNSPDAGTRPKGMQRKCNGIQERTGCRLSMLG